MSAPSTRPNAVARVSMFSMPISSPRTRPLEGRGAGGPLAELSIGVNGSLEDAGEEDGRRGGPRATADMVVAARGALADHRVAGPGADRAGGLAARRARAGRLLGGGGRWCARLRGDHRVTSDGPGSGVFAAPAEPIYVLDNDPRIQDNAASVKPCPQTGSLNGGPEPVVKFGCGLTGRERTHRSPLDQVR